MNNNVDNRIQGLIDSHCHLIQKETEFNLEQVISSCKDADMAALITICAQPSELDASIMLTEQHKNFIFATAGMHPLETVTHSEKEVDAYIERIKQNKQRIKAIGEIGIDNVLVKDPGKAETSRDVFIQFIELAKELRLPIVIHCREAFPEVIKTLSDRGADNVVFHYFNQPDFVTDIKEFGWRLSLPTILAFSKNKMKRTMELAGLDIVMAETDSPIDISGGRKLAPVDVKAVVEGIATAIGASPHEVAKTTVENAVRFFSLPKELIRF